jgi:hypothetical protein
MRNAGRNLEIKKAEILRRKLEIKKAEIQRKKLSMDPKILKPFDINNDNVLDNGEIELLVNAYNARKV